VKEYHAGRYPLRKWEKCASGPLALGNATGPNTNPVLEPEQATFYQSQIGVLHWTIELGRIDMIMEGSELSLFLTMPRKGTLMPCFIYSIIWKRNMMPE
jgi:hypothetical protein